MIREATLSDHARPGSNFPDRVALLLARIDCRLIVSGEQREAIFRLRYEAGMREQAISRPSSLNLSDRYDNVGNAYLFGLYIDDELASSIRLHIASKEQREFPSINVFADVLESKLDTGQVIVGCSRFVADEHLSQLNRELPYATLRCCMLAAEHFNADYLITAASPMHQAFYRRAFNYRTISEPRFDPHAASPVRLMALNYQTSAEDLYWQYAFYRSTPAERRKLFSHTRFAPAVS
jgi:N-acyl-L-homoserine lactone synthetase